MRFVDIDRQKNVGINPIRLHEREASIKRRTIEDSPDDFVVIYKAYNNDCYVRRCCDKFLEILFKNGYKYHYENKDAYDYLMRRIRIIEVAMNRPFKLFLSDLTSHLIQYDNAFLLKHKDNIRGIRSKIDGIILGYEVLHPSTISMEKDADTGNLYRYLQSPPMVRPISNSTGRRKKKDEDYREFPVERIIHLATSSDAIYKFASPSKASAIADSIILRELEDSCFTMVQRFVFPFIHMSIMGAGDERVQQFRDLINQGPIDGIFVSNDAIAFDNIGGKSNIVNGIDYLKYLEDRVFTGLGMSQVLMGRGDNMSRATADSILVHIQDSIKDMQKIISGSINMYIFDEILNEGGFDILNNDNRVFMKFNEIDISSMIAYQTHMNQQYITNAITHSEMRKELGFKELSGEREGELYYNKFPSVNSSLESAFNSNDNMLRPANQKKKRQSPKRDSENYELESSIFRASVAVMNNDRDKAINLVNKTLKLYNDTDHDYTEKAADIINSIYDNINKEK